MPIKRERCLSLGSAVHFSLNVYVYETVLTRNEATLNSLGHCSLYLPFIAQWYSDQNVH